MGRSYWRSASLARALSAFVQDMFRCRLERRATLLLIHLLDVLVPGGYLCVSGRDRSSHLRILWHARHCVHGPKFSMGWTLLPHRKHRPLKVPLYV